MANRQFVKAGWNLLGKIQKVNQDTSLDLKPLLCSHDNDNKDAENHRNDGAL